jgi:hypothetical protein
MTPDRVKEKPRRITGGIVLDKKEKGGKYEVVSEKLYNMNQSWNYKLIVVVGRGKNKHKLRVDIRNNAYDFQSHAKISRWDGDKWYFVTSKPIEDCSCEAAVYVLRLDEHFDISIFRKDAIDLIEEAKAVVL